MGKLQKIHKKYRTSICPNCSTPLDVSDVYCHYCGQKNSTKRLTLKDFFNEFFANIVSYDSRLQKSIQTLLFRPGKISKDYIQGKRARYVNPFRFYLSVSIIFFLLSSLTFELDDLEISNEEADTENPMKIKLNINDGISGNQLVTINDSIPIDEDSLKPTTYTTAQLDTMSFNTALNSRWLMYRDYYKKTHERSASIALKKMNHQPTWWNKTLYGRTTKFDNIEEGITDLTKFIFNKLPLIIFFFLPVFALGIWALYWRRPFNYMEHLIFIFHVQTLFFLLMGISYLIEQITNSPIPSSIAQLLFILYLYKAMRYFYEQKRGKTILKFFLANLIFFTLAGVGGILTIAVSAVVF